jgi:hypothetical protein
MSFKRGIDIKQALGLGVIERLKKLADFDKEFLRMIVNGEWDSSDKEEFQPNDFHYLKYYYYKGKKKDFDIFLTYVINRGEYDEEIKYLFYEAFLRELQWKLPWTKPERNLHKVNSIISAGGKAYLDFYQKMLKEDIEAFEYTTRREPYRKYLDVGSKRG